MILEAAVLHRVDGELECGRGLVEQAAVIAIPVLGEWPSFSDCAAILAVSLGVFCAAGARLRAVKPH